MSLEKVVLRCLCLPCLSLSLTSLCLDLCLSRGGGGRVTRPHSHLRVGGGFIYLSEEASPGGRGRFIYLFIGGSSAGSLLRHGARSLVVARGFRTRSLEGLQGFGGTIGVLSDVGSQLPATKHGRSSARTILSH
jgi:hypothetical protein